MMKSTLVSLTALCLLAACDGASTTPTPTPTPTPTTPTAQIGRNPSDYMRSIITRSTFETAGAGRALEAISEPITAANAPRGRATLTGLADLYISGITENIPGMTETSLTGDVTLDADFEQGAISGKADRFAFYELTGSGTYDVKAARVRMVTGSLDLSGTLQQKATALAGTLAVSGALADTGPNPVSIGEVSAQLEGAIVRNRDHNNKLLAIFGTGSGISVGGRVENGQINILANE